MNPCKQFSINDLIEFGLPLLMGMSIRQFEFFKDALGFTGQYKPEFIPIGKEFSRTALRSLTIKLPDEPKNEVYDEASLLVAWETAFARLEIIDSASDVCRWMMQLKSAEMLFVRPAQASGWSNLLYNLAMETKILPPLTLAREKIQDLKILVLQEFLKEAVQHHAFVNLEKYDEFDDWERYIYKERVKGLWMQNRCRLCLKLKMWEGIFGLLTESEIAILDRWGYENIEESNRLYGYTSLPDLARDLQAAEYY